MPLPKPDLDDKTFNQLVDEAIKLIPRYAPQWTNHNLSDPGITFIDLFAWLTEMTLYRINLETDLHKLKYLQLLGVSPEPPTPAKVDLTFEPVQELKITRGTEVTTEIDVTGKSISFEIDEDITIVPVQMKKVIVDEYTGVFDRTDANEKSDQFFAPFGLSVRDNCKLYLGFDRCSQELNFMCYLYENDLIQPGKHGKEPDCEFENAQFKWEYHVSGNTKKTIQPVKDETKGFKKSGRIFFTDIQDWVKSKIPVWNNDEYFWLICTIEKSKDNVYFEYPPRIDTIKLNTISATHGLTIENEKKKLLSDGLPGQVLELSNTPVINDTLELESDELLFNWNGISENGADNEKLIRYLMTKFSVPWVQEAIIEKINEDIIKVSYRKNDITLKNLDPELEKARISLMRDDGMTYEFIGIKDGGKLSIYDGIWKEVQDFDSSGPDDNHYVLDKEQGIIKFGNGMYGRVPPVYTEIKAVRYRAGGGAEGNIKAGYLWKINGHYGLTINNNRAATGGKETEDLNDVAGRFLRDLKVPYTAVTSSDFERIVTDTPGLRVGKAKSIANYRFINGSEIKSKGSVTVVVIPYTPLDILETPPKPSQGFMDAICQHLDKHRLLGTDVHVVRPVYVKVDVMVTIVPLNGFPEKELRNKVQRKLTQFLHPVKGGKDNKGWPIGRMVTRSEIYELIEKITGVDCVTGLTISGGKGSRMDKNGNLELISKITTIYPGSLNVTIIAEVVGV